MATEIKLPRLGQGMESGTIVKWLKAEGEEVEKGEPLYELDTDKVTQEVEAEADGVLLKIAVESGETAVGTTIAVIGKEGEEIAIEAPQAAAKPAEKPAAAPEPEREAPIEPSVSRANGRTKASPLARRIARERNIDLAQVRGTGPDRTASGNAWASSRRYDSNISSEPCASTRAPASVPARRIVSRPFAGE